MMKFRTACIAGLAAAIFALSAAPASAAFPIFGKKPKDDLPARKLTPAQNALVDKAVAREAEVIKLIQDRSPLVETYIQNMKPDAELLQVPESDEHFLGRVDFKKVLNGDVYQTEDTRKNNGKLGFFKNSLSYVTSLNRQLHLQFNETGFIQMILIDAHGFDRTEYNFGFVRNDFLGSVPTMVFDVEPAKGSNYSKHQL